MNIKQKIKEKMEKIGYSNLTTKEKDILGAPDMSEIIYSEALRCLGRDISPRENEFACAESVNTLFVFALGEPIGGGTSTNAMYKILKSNKRFQKINEPKRGDIIISPTGYSKSVKVKNGHVGIVSDKLVDSNDIKIMSNASKTSLWTQNYTLKSWRNRWQKNGYPVLFFRVIS
jgi:hypothetical protein